MDSMFGDVLELMKNENLDQLRTIAEQLNEVLYKEKRISQLSIADLLTKGCLSKDHFAESFIPNGFTKQQGQRFFAVRTKPDGNCLYNAVSVALFGSTSFSSHLRILTSIELYLHPHYYFSHPVFSKAFDSQDSNSIQRSKVTFFRLSLKNSTIDSCNTDDMEAVKIEATSNCKNKEWSSFLCLLGLASVIRAEIQSVFPDSGSVLDRLLKNQLVSPRSFCNTNQKLFILFCKLETMATKITEGVVEVFQSNHFVQLLPFLHTKTLKKRKLNTSESYSNSSVVKKMNLEFPVASSSKTTQSKIMFHTVTKNFQKANDTSTTLKVGKEELEDNIKPFTNDRIINKTLSSKTSNVVHPNSQDNILKGKLDVSTFRNIHLNGISSEEKHALIKSVFIPDKYYPFQVPKGGKRKFVFKWLSQHKWLCFSHIDQGAYCLPCVLFARKDIGSSKRLISQPFIRFNDATPYFRAHERCKEGNHVDSLMAYNMFLNEMSGKSLPVNLTLSKVNIEQAKKNRLVLLSVIDTVLLCSRLGLAFRGNRDSNKDDESDPELGKIYTGMGNFKACLHFAVQQGNTILGKHLKHGSKNAKYTSHITQNQLLQCIYELMTETVISEIRKSKYYSILADEASDSANLEQMSFCVRFVDENCEIREEFLKFINCSDDVSAKGLYEGIKEALATFGLDIADCRGQGYDGAAAVSGHKTGVAARIRADNSKAVYTHCFNHRLNLAVSSTYKILIVRDTMDAIRDITFFFSISPIRNNTYKKVCADYPDYTGTKLIDVCKTRWLERIHGFDVFQKNYEVIYATLFYLSQASTTNSKTRSQALGFCKKMVDFDFIFTLVTLRNVLGYTKNTTTFMQQKSIDVLKGFEFIKSEISKLELIRAKPNEKHDIWYKEAVDLAAKIGAEPTKPRTCLRQNHRNNVPADTVSDYFFRSVSLPIVDTILNQLKTRFSTDCEYVLDGLFILPYVMLQSISISGCNLAWKQKFRSFLDFFASDFSEFPETAIEQEMEMWEHHWTRINENIPDSVVSTLLAIKVEGLFDITKRALRILGTIPVTSCTCERSISTLRLLKTYTRSRMTNDRLNAVAMIYINKEKTPTKEAILERYNSKGKHRMHTDFK